MSEAVDKEPYSRLAVLEDRVYKNEIGLTEIKSKQANNEEISKIQHQCLEAGMLLLTKELSSINKKITAIGITIISLLFAGFIALAGYIWFDLVSVQKHNSAMIQKQNEQRTWGL